MPLDVTLQPAESGAYVYKYREDITVHTEMLKDIAEMVLDDVVKGEVFEYRKGRVHPAGLTEAEHLNWVFLVNTLNFSFWPDDGFPVHTVTYQNDSWTGYHALCASLLRLHDARVPVCTAAWMTTVTFGELNFFLANDDVKKIPMIEERWQALLESGEWLARHGGQFENVVNRCGGEAMTLLKSIMTIESFRDTTMYKGQKIAFLARAQRLIADVRDVLKEYAAQAAGGVRFVDFTDIDKLTNFADYRTPQVLCYLGAFEYGAEMAATIKNKGRLQHGHAYEVQLRGCSIHAVMEIYKEVQRLRDGGYKDHDWSTERHLLPIDIDVWLWQLRSHDAAAVEACTPHHRTRSKFY